MLTDSEPVFMASLNVRMNWSGSSISLISNPTNVGGVLSLVKLLTASAFSGSTPVKKLPSTSVVEFANMETKKLAEEFARPYIVLMLFRSLAVSRIGTTDWGSDTWTLPPVRV